MLADACSEFVDLHEILHPREAEPDVEVPPQERMRLFSTYQRIDGVRLDKRRVSCWIQQFGDKRKQRLASLLLNGVDYYDSRRIRSIFQHLITNELSDIPRSQIGVALLGNPGDSSALVSYLTRDIIIQTGTRYGDL